jgi:hypothetical protein
MRRDQRDRAEGAVAGQDRHDHHRPDPELAEERQMVRVLRTSHQLRVRDALVQLGTPASNHAPHAADMARILRIPALKLTGERDLAGVHVSDRHVDELLPLEQIDRAPVGEAGHE